ncbi:hypothetical protein HHI36_013397 [Cryptolaemus montrouzieri]|uniref:Uncharacterized protein n=1 Tax=Cryptolaemus montrouzieri TaxID=559131 RepID=A0ABD2NI39_9CUCU
MSDVSFSDIYEDEYLEERQVGQLRRPRLFRYRTNPMDCFNDIQFKMRFRFDKNTVRFLLESFGTEPNLTLRFYGTGSI